MKYCHLKSKNKNASDKPVPIDKPPKVNYHDGEQIKGSLTKEEADMREGRSDFSELFEKAAKTAGVILEAAYQGLTMIERNVFEVLDKQIVSRLLNQYDKLVKAGFTHEEALSAVTDLVRKRLETAIRERK